jgi:hypothetical protein
MPGRDGRVRPVRRVPPGGTTDERTPCLTGPRRHPEDSSRCSCVRTAHAAIATDAPLVPSSVVPWAATGRRGLLPGAVLVIAVVLAACSPLTSAPSAAPTAPSGDPPTPSLVASPLASVVAVGVDGSLLDILPARIDGAALTPDAETAAGIAADVSGDPSLAGDLDALAVGLYAGRDDYAVVTITRLRQGPFGEDYFRDWRDSFDEAVCAQAGGVDGHAEAPIGGRTTYIGTCVGGVRTYHVRLAGPDRIVSLQALGDARYGEQIVAGLTE